MKKMNAVISFPLPLPLRLTLFYALLLGLILSGFGYLVYHQAEQRAYSDLDALLKNRAASIKMGKDLFFAANAEQKNAPLKLPGVNELGTDGVAIEVFDTHLTLLATTSDAGTNTPLTTRMDDAPSPVPWDAQAARSILAELDQLSFSSDNALGAGFIGIYSTITYEGQAVRVYTTVNNPLGTTQIIQTARSELSVQQSLAQLRQTLLTAGLLGLLLAVFGGLLLTWGTLAALRRVTRTAHEISLSQDFSQRVPLARGRTRDEITTLAETFNAMLTNLESSYQRQKRFVADASHELRAPVTSIRCNLDLLARISDLPAEEKAAVLTDARLEAERMGRLVNNLLTLARADEIASTREEKRSAIAAISAASGKLALVDLDTLLLEVFRQYRETGQQDRPRLLLQHITPARIYGQPDQLKQVIVALVDNALKYTPARGTVELALTIEQQSAILKVSDTGIGIAAEDLPHIFERFYRASHANPHEPGGSGLGLAIAWSITQEHHGHIDVDSTPGQGSTFLVHLPCARAV